VFIVEFRESQAASESSGLSVVSAVSAAPNDLNRFRKSTMIPKKHRAPVQTGALAHGKSGPCRNRTYNLAIKSRLLCQLS
jgi:hypothetical protein